jgi:hypothetical protein
MDKRREDRQQDTGTIELERILKCLKTNDYVFEEVKAAPVNYGYMIATFNKDIKYADRTGNYVNDRNIKISVEFDRDFDYKNDYNNYDEEEEGEYKFDKNKGSDFITKLVSSTYGGRSRKIIKKKKTNKTKRIKNRRK